jgi:protein-disulfide isomerase-like protein with CxxC motif
MGVAMRMLTRLAIARGMEIVKARPAFKAAEAKRQREAHINAEAEALAAAGIPTLYRGTKGWILTDGRPIADDLLETIRSARKLKAAA